MGVLKVNVGGNWVPVTSRSGGLLPAGGSTSQRLTKKSSIDNDTVWAGTARNEYVADTAWHEFGAPGEPVLQNGWVNYGSAGWATAAYRMDSEGWVYLKGLVRSGTASPMFVLPPAYRPWKTYFAPALTAEGQVGYVQVGMDGTLVYWLGWGTNTWLQLDMIRFPVWNRWSQFAGRYIPLEGTNLRGPTNWAEYATGLWPQPNGMTRVMGISGGFAGGGGNSITHLNNLGGHFMSSLFGVASEDQAGSRCFQIGARHGFYFHGPGPATNWTMFSSEYGTMACEDQWIAPSLLNGWANHGPDTVGRYAPSGYWKDNAGVVHLRGLIRYGTAPNAVILVLPEGYRPAGNVMWWAGSGLGTAPCRIDVRADGSVYASTGGSTGWTSLDGINFYAAGA